MKQHPYIRIFFLTLILFSGQCQSKVTNSEKGEGEFQLSPIPSKTGQNDVNNDTEDAIQGSENVRTKISGQMMKAFLVAYDAFKNDPAISQGKKRIENYDIEFSQRRKGYVVLFTARRLPSERELEGGESSLGRDVEYTVSKKDYQIVERMMFK